MVYPLVQTRSRQTPFIFGPVSAASHGRSFSEAHPCILLSLQQVPPRTPPRGGGNSS